MPTVSRAASTSSASSSSSPAVAARAWAEGFDFTNASAVKKLQVSRSKAPTTGPASLQRAFAFYKAWEANDLGSARLLKTSINGKPGFALHTTTDGDDGFLELYNDKGTLLASGVTRFDAQGKPDIKWDSKLGAVRERVAPKRGSPSVAAFFKAIDKAGKASSPSGATVSAKELKDAAKNLVGTDFTAASVDGQERAGLLRALVESKFSSSTRAWGEKLAELYTPDPSASLSHVNFGPFGTDSEFQRQARVALANVSASGAPPKLNTMVALSRRAWDQVPAQLTPVTHSEAQTLLRTAGASAADAKAMLDTLADSKGLLYAGRFFEFDGSSAGIVPVPKGLALFGVPASGRELRALNVPLKAEPAVGPDPRAVIKQLLGVDRDVLVKATRKTSTATQFDLEWRPPTGGTLSAKLNVPKNGSDATVEGLSMPSVVGMTETGLADRISAATGVPQVGLSYAQSGSDWLVAHRPAAGGPVKLSLVKVALGGATASVTPATIGSGAAQTEVARSLSLGLARVHAETLVANAGNPDDARLEVALRTRWASFADMQSVAPADSAVGFDATKDRAQFMLSRVWGDNAVFVTFAKDGSVRLEDFN